MTPGVNHHDRSSIDRFVPRSIFLLLSDPVLYLSAMEHQQPDPSTTTPSNENGSPVAKTKPVAATPKPRPGRKPKAESAAGTKELRWSVPMVETLLRLRRETHVKYFQSKNNPKAAGDGWAL